MSRLDEKVRKQIREKFRETGAIRAVARELKISRNAVRRELERLAGPPTVCQAPPRSSKLDPFKEKIGHLVCEKRLTAVRVLEEIQELGYDGGYSILKEYIRQIRPKGVRPPTTVIQHKPGQEAQMDWSPHRAILGGRETVVHTGSIVLCYSRWLFARMLPDETLENVILLHEEAFRELGAVPEKITYDNMTTVGRHTGPGEVWINPAFQRFSERYGFEIVILKPGAKDRHGIVERPFRYIETNFLAGREFNDLKDLNKRLDHWRAVKANVRIHGTLRERPVDRLKRERPFLKAFANPCADTFRSEVERLVHRDFTIAVDTNHYSVGLHLVGRRVSVRLFRDYLEVWANDRMDCRHLYCKGKYQRQILPEHEEAFRASTHQHRLIERALSCIGDIAGEYYEGLQKERGGTAGFHLQRILKLADRYGSDVVAGALAQAKRHGVYSADAVTRIVQGKSVQKKGMEIPETMPEGFREWLKSLSVEKAKLDRFDSLIDQGKKNDTTP